MVLGFMRAPIARGTQPRTLFGRGWVTASGWRRCDIQMRNPTGSGPGRRLLAPSQPHPGVAPAPSECVRTGGPAARAAWHAVTWATNSPRVVKPTSAPSCHGICAFRGSRCPFLVRSTRLPGVHRVQVAGDRQVAQRGNQAEQRVTDAHRHPASSMDAQINGWAGPGMCASWPEHRAPLSSIVRSTIHAFPSRGSPLRSGVAGPLRSDPWR